VEEIAGLTKIDGLYYDYWTQKLNWEGYGVDKYL
jgi:hypothetical protein